MRNKLPFGSLAPLFPEKLRDAAGKTGIKEDAEVKRVQTINPKTEELEPGSRTAINIVSTKDIDRDNEVIDPAGWVLDDFLKSPSVFLNHSTFDLPIGTDEKLGLDDAQRLISKTRYGSTPTAQDVFTLKQEGIMRMSSVGFIPLESVEQGGSGFEAVAKKLGKKWGVDLQGVSAIITKAYLLEHSDVGLAANMGAEQLAVAKGMKLNAATFIAMGIESAKGVIPYKDLGKQPEDTAWDGPAQIREADVDVLKIICTWFDGEDAENKGAYKLPHHAAAGKHPANWKGVSAAMGALLGARGGVDVPSGDRKGIYNHLKKHYAQFDKEAPEFRDYKPEEIEKLFGDPKPVKIITAVKRLTRVRLVPKQPSVAVLIEDELARHRGQP
jgi:hypothetical protein